ncbi:uncharacterized protein LOC111366082 [Olea europaea subsp. europaea]|uniref:Uncharacterized protein LOC111366082 n=1 Tax=Olea europaea subsp. europaea TaxID=158383 RepID=A0A8S0TTY0_OLEEU|nr:uncharacterized protein LOC111366082 [Olea europaea subsp. europaea]
MEGGAAAVSTEKASESAASASYTYWVRELTHDAAPRPVPKKLNVEDLSNHSNPTHLGSVWNRAGTWEEKSLNKWASDRIKELLVSVGTLEFSGGKAEIEEVTRCSGDAFIVTVRNKKRVGYNYELTLRVKGNSLLFFLFYRIVVVYFILFSFLFPCYCLLIHFFHK